MHITYDMLDEKKLRDCYESQIIILNLLKEKFPDVEDSPYIMITLSMIVAMKMKDLNLSKQEVNEFLYDLSHNAKVFYYDEQGTTFPINEVNAIQ